MNKQKKMLGFWTLVVLAILFVITEKPATAAAPSVVKTVPENGQNDVDPKLKQIRIEFNQNMNTGGMSICGSGPNFPKMIGKPRWVNNRAIIAKVELLPNHDYELSVNCQSFRNFKNLKGESAEIYPIKFRTGSFKKNNKPEEPVIDENNTSVVAKTIPENGEKSVDPNLKEIRIVFEQDMDTSGGVSICGGGPNFPNIIDKPKWVDTRTFVMQVKLEAGHHYAFSINCPSANNFKSAKGEPVEPYPVEFKTAEHK